MSVNHRISCSRPKFMFCVEAKSHCWIVFILTQTTIFSKQFQCLCSSISIICFKRWTIQDQLYSSHISHIFYIYIESVTLFSFFLTCARDYELYVWFWFAYITEMAETGIYKFSRWHSGASSGQNVVNMFSLTSYLQLAKLTACSCAHLIR